MNYNRVISVYVILNWIFIHLTNQCYKKYSLLFILSLSFLSCNILQPPILGNPVVELSFEDASCSEIWLKLKINSTIIDNNVTIFRNDSAIFTLYEITLGKDSLLIDSHLFPNTNYVYKALLGDNNSPSFGVYSNKVVSQTVDTTSHTFTFQTFTFGGEAGSCVLNDIAIIDENNIWAVGAIYLKDSLGRPDPTVYNAVHWNGTDWQLFRVKFFTFCGQPGTHPYRASSVFALNEDEIIISHGDKIAFLKGTVQVKTECIPVYVNKIWGTDKNNIYVVGWAGDIAHYDGQSWSKLRNDSEVELLDIYGTQDGKNIWAGGNEDYKPSVLLKISGSRVENIFSSNEYLFQFNPNRISGGINSVWAKNDRFVYISTWYSLYRKLINSDSSRADALRLGDPLTWHGIKTRGTDINNIFTVGNAGTVHHFNGLTWKTYQELANNKVTYFGLDVKDNLSVLCGRIYKNGISDQAIITIINK